MENERNREQGALGSLFGVVAGSLWYGLSTRDYRTSFALIGMAVAARSRGTDGAVEHAGSGR